VKLEEAKSKGDIAAEEIKKKEEAIAKAKQKIEELKEKIKTQKTAIGKE
tara:strand:- start:4784 stop:4930 length:147 start_codon:yes stop_codon:yes gene_type:complete